MKFKILTLLLAIFLIGTSNIFAQEMSTREFQKKLLIANDHFSIENYHLCYPLFKDLFESKKGNTEVNYKLGVCLYKMRRNKLEAKDYFETAKTDYLDAYVYLGQLYHLSEKFDGALELYNHYKNSPVEEKEFSNEVVNYLIEKSNTAKKLISKDNKVEIKKIPIINTDGQEYVPVIDASERIMIFTSRREGSTGAKLDPNGEFFEDLYITKKQGNNWTKPMNMGAPINSSTHDASVSISADGKKLFIYRTSPDLYSGDIYMSTFENNRWGEPKKLKGDINTNQGVEASASLAPNEQVLYFSSDRPGGFGGQDLYVVNKLPNGDWAKIRNLGPTINTPYDEDAPFIHSDGTTLYFSSKGHENMGGYDIYKTTIMEDGKWSVPANLGYPINTVSDDVYFVVSANERRGYYSSNRGGNSDIYQINMPENPANRIILKGTVTTNEPVFKTLHATITILDYDTKEMQGIYRTNNKTGKYLMVLQPRKHYKMVVESKGYYSYVGEINMKEKLRFEDLFKDINLERVNDKPLITVPKEDIDMTDSTATDSVKVKEDQVPVEGLPGMDEDSGKGDDGRARKEDE